MTTLIPGNSLGPLASVIPVLGDVVAEQLAAVNPKVIVHDCFVLPNALEARVKIEVTPAPRDSVWGEWGTRNGTGTNSGNQYIGVAKMPFAVHPDGPNFAEAVVTLRGNNVPGNTIEVYLTGVPGGATTLDGSGFIRVVSELPFELPGGFNTLVYETDFIDGFEATDSGFNAANQPCWRTRFHFGRDQVGNKELGLYADASVYPGIADPFPIVDGVRAMRGQKFASPIVYGNKTFYYGAAMLSSQRIPALNQIGVGNRVEIEAALPINGKLGLWPAIWLLPTSLGWPPEIDIMERPIISGDTSYQFYTTHHWPGVGTNEKKGFKIDTKEPGIAAATDTASFHTYGLSFDGSRLVFDYDGKTSCVIENHAQSSSWYLILNMAVGGLWPGMPYGGTKFPADASFPADMLVKALRVYAKA